MTYKTFMGLICGISFGLLPFHMVLASALFALAFTAVLIRGA